MQNYMKEVKLIMLNEFENQLDIIFKKYFNNDLSFNDCKNMINWLKTSWGISRIDIKNLGIFSNSINLINPEKELSVSFPNWFEDDTGKGCVIEYNNKNILLKFSCVNDGDLNLILRGEDFRNVNHQRVPIYINFTKLVINDKIIFNSDKLVWHNDPYIFTKKSLNNEEFNIKLESKTIYDYFPKLGLFLDNLIKNVDDLNIFYKEMKYFFRNEKSYSNLNNILNSDCNLMDDNSLILHDSLNNSMNLYLLSKRYDDLKKQFEQYKEEIDEVLKSYNTLFNSLFINHKIEPKLLVQNSHDLNLEILDFIDNICKKYGLKWWLHYGTLLGAIRHGGFIPWDDDCDINMMREDYEKFLKVASSEIDNHNLSDNLEVSTTEITNNGVFLPFIKVNYWVEKDLFGFIDIFPKDYVYNVLTNHEHIFKEECDRIQFELKKGLNRDNVLNSAFKKLNVSKNKTNLVMSGVEDPLFNVYDYDTLFPLKTIKFENRRYPCPNDIKTVIKSFYGESYNKLPKLIYNHGFYDYLSNHENVYTKFEEEISKLKMINENF